MMSFLNQEKGFSIVEAVVAQVVLILGALCVWNIFVAGSRFNAESEDLTIAANVAQLQIEKMMNTRFRYIISEHPEGETYFTSERQDEPFWVLSSQGEWISSLPEGRYVVSYPDGVDADPLRVMVTVLWNGHYDSESSLSLETLVSMTPGRFRG
jgi:type II secretory pathway pseudopilin PulG